MSLRANVLHRFWLYFLLWVLPSLWVRGQWGSNYYLWVGPREYTLFPLQRYNSTFCFHFQFSNYFVNLMERHKSPLKHACLLFCHCNTFQITFIQVVSCSYTYGSFHSKIQKETKETYKCGNECYTKCEGQQIVAFPSRQRHVCKNCLFSDAG